MRIVILAIPKKQFGFNKVEINRIRIPNLKLPFKYIFPVEIGKKIINKGKMYARYDERLHMILL